MSDPHPLRPRCDLLRFPQELRPNPSDPSTILLLRQNSMLLQYDFILAAYFLAALLLCIDYTYIDLVTWVLEVPNETTISQKRT